MAKNATHSTLFWDKVDTDGECWLWTAGTTAFGYGKLRRLGKTLVAHRYVYEQVFGPIPDGICVCHRCDVPACVRPAHLFLGTHQDNMQDMWSKGRGIQGQRQKTSILTSDQVRAIRHLYSTTSISQRALGDQFGVSQPAINQILKRRIGAHVQDQQ